ncbi:carboxypeptidase regulatory-like domain-containing protein [Planctomicrobium sp. SH661]|uniref:carboxypeptidase regulatory-like domain-containing protein n=1 Tax=Planctomicrobium sp. SH661 TaxID=3448124 RepID=UPI003F5CB7FA
MIRFGFSLAILLGICSPVLADGWGSVEGQIILDGDVPAPQFLVKKGDTTVKDAAVCAKDGVPDDSMAFDPETKGIANVFVYLPKAPSKIHPDLKASAEKEVVFDQLGCNFLPHCLIVRTDQDVVCKSSDAVAHNLHTNPFSNTAQNFIVQPNDQTGTPVKMAIAERNPVKVQCDIHPWMGAYWLVLDHPYAAVTDKDGKFKIDNLPEGTHEFRVWNSKAGNIDKKLVVKVKAGETTTVPVKKVPLASFQK